MRIFLHVSGNGSSTRQETVGCASFARAHNTGSGDYGGGQPIMKDGSLNFEWRPGVPIHDEHINEIDVGIGFNLEGGDAD